MANIEPVKAQATNWARHLVNLWQSTEERKDKYWLAISLGANCYQAQRMRDWRLSKIERFFNLVPNSIAL